MQNDSNLVLDLDHYSSDQIHFMEHKKPCHLLLTGFHGGIINKQTHASNMMIQAHLSLCTGNVFCLQPQQNSTSM